MIEISQIKQRAKASLRGKLGNAIVALLVAILVSVAASLIPLGNFLIGGPLLIGTVLYFLFLAQGKEVTVGVIFKPFNFYGNALLTYFLRMIVGILAIVPLILYIVIWILSNSAALDADMISTGKIVGFIITLLILFLIPFYVAIRLELMYYIVADNPGVPADKALEISWKMMKQHIWDYIVLVLSFILWFLLSIITLGIAFFWLIPFFNTSVAHFYLELKNLYPEYAQMIDSYGRVETDNPQVNSVYLNEGE